MTDGNISKSIDRLTDIAFLGFIERLKRFRYDVLKNFEKNHRDKIMVGVFGYYDVKHSDGKNGEEVIDYLSDEFAKRNFFIVNGKHMVHMGTKGDIIHESSMHDDLKKEDVKRWGWHQVSKIFASIPSKAVFIITRESGSEIYEIQEFGVNRFGDKECGIGFILVNKINETCKKLNKIGNSGKLYCCFSNNIESCIGVGDKGNCIFTSIGGISAGRIHEFLMKKHMCICTIDDYKNIPDSAPEVFSLHSTVS